jgi:transcriptional regulator with XRE-family HTH domain
MPSGLYPAIDYGRASLAKKLSGQRRKAGLSVEQLAKKAKVSVQTVHQLERGEKPASIAAIDRIDRVLRAANE